MRKRSVRRNLSIAGDTTVDGIIQQVSACSATNSGNATTLTDTDTAVKRRRQNLSNASDTAVTALVPEVSTCSSTNNGNAVTQNSRTDADTTAKRRRVRNVNTNCQSAETSSSDAVNTRILTAEENALNVSDNSVNCHSLRLRKSSSAKTAVIKNSGCSVVEQCTEAAAAAAAAVLACSVVIEKASCVSGQGIARNTTLVDGHNEKVGTTSRGRRRKSQTADHDVEPVDAALINIHATSCKYCC